MKNIFKSILFVLTLIMMQLSVNAQNNVKKKTEELLIGTWSFDFTKSTDSISPNSKKMYGRLDSRIQDNIKQSYSRRKLSFLPDGKLILELAPGTQRKGIWKLLKDQKSLYIKMENGRELNQRVERISTSSLSLNLGGNQSKEDKRLFHKWYLNKVN